MMSWGAGANDCWVLQGIDSTIVPASTGIPILTGQTFNIGLYGTIAYALRDALGSNIVMTRNTFIAGAYSVLEPQSSGDTLHTSTGFSDSSGPIFGVIDFWTINQQQELIHRRGP